MEEDGDESRIDSLLRSEAMDARLDRFIEPHLAARRRNASATTRSRLRLAVLLPGAVRTMLDATHLAEFAAAFLELQQEATYLRTFAYLSLTWETGCLSDSCGRVDERHAARTSADVRAAFARWGVGLDLELHQATGGTLLPPPISSVCVRQREMMTHYEAKMRSAVRAGFKMGGPATGMPQVHQFRKVYAAMRMLVRHEERIGTVRSQHHSIAEPALPLPTACFRGARRSIPAPAQSFDVILRLRPDLCMGSTRTFLAFAMRRTTATSAVPFFSADGLAVIPRWAADAYAEFWRAHAYGCACVSEALSTCEPSPGSDSHARLLSSAC